VDAVEIEELCKGTISFDVGAASDRTCTGSLGGDG